MEKHYKFYRILNQEKKVFSVYLGPTPKAGSTKYLPHQALPSPPNPREGFADTSPQGQAGDMPWEDSHTPARPQEAFLNCSLKQKM